MPLFSIVLGLMSLIVLSGVVYFVTKDWLNVRNYVLISLGISLLNSGLGFIFRATSAPDIISLFFAVLLLVFSFILNLNYVFDGDVKDLLKFIGITFLVYFFISVFGVLFSLTEPLTTGSIAKIINNTLEASS